MAFLRLEVSNVFALQKRAQPVLPLTRHALRMLAGRGSCVGQFFIKIDQQNHSYIVALKRGLMKKIGMIGGMSWESTQHYYQIMNQRVVQLLGGHSSIEAILYSVNFERVMEFVHRDAWDEVTRIILEIAQTLEKCGAEFLIMTSNAIHKVIPQLENQLQIPILHIADPTGDAILKKGVKKIGLLGTRVTMEELFYQDRLKKKYGIHCITPHKIERDRLHEIIFEELTVGKIASSSKKQVLSMISEIKTAGAEGIILGCTELTLLISQKDTDVPLFDTTQLHATAAVDLSIMGDMQ